MVGSHLTWVMGPEFGPSAMALHALNESVNHTSSLGNIFKTLSRRLSDSSLCMMGREGVCSFVRLVWSCCLDVRGKNSKAILIVR